MQAATKDLVLATPEWVDRDRLQALPPNPASLVDAIRQGDRSFAQAGGPRHISDGRPKCADEGQRIIESLGAILGEAVMEAWESRERSRGIRCPIRRCTRT